ncbi:MAG: prepilin-type N-terminal cleavage/methylation domain-containing protein [Coxiellaceae bacterium]|jgi:prepilin-type N-terminal cleavage/methylation domain-containing protein|nr:prepilin-type N-terminal cleavage/methylation domain-containing protein [Coxiellaceae bacterium]
MLQYRKYQGYNLIEFIIVIVLVSILVAGSSNILSLGFNIFFSQKNIIQTNWQASIALERMTRDLHEISSIKDLTEASTNKISFFDLNDNLITYERNSDNKLKRNNNILADKVQQIEFHYYDNESGELTQPQLIQSQNREKVRYIRITLTMIDINPSFSITTAVYLWNLK